MLQFERQQSILQYLQQHAAEAVRWLLNEKDHSGLLFLLQNVDIDKDDIAEGCAIARELHQTEGLAILLEEQHKRFPVGLNKSFDL